MRSYVMKLFHSKKEKLPHARHRPVLVMLYIVLYYIWIGTVAYLHAKIKAQSNGIDLFMHLIEVTKKNYKEHETNYMQKEKKNNLQMEYMKIQWEPNSIAQFFIKGQSLSCQAALEMREGIEQSS